MSDEITARLADLIKTGRELLDDVASQDDAAWIDFGEVTIYESWLVSAGQLLLTTVGPESEQFGRFREIVNSQRNPSGVKTYVVRQAFDLMLSVYEEWTCGSLRMFEDIVAAQILDDLLDQAGDYRYPERRVESSALACAVLEHVMRRIAARNRIEFRGKTLEALADELAGSSVLDEEASRRLKESLAVRTRASAADRKAIRRDDVEGLIANTRKLVERFV
jgi:hypothetical protein